MAILTQKDILSNSRTVEYDPELASRLAAEIEDLKKRKLAERKAKEEAFMQQRIEERNKLLEGKGLIPGHDGHQTDPNRPVAYPYIAGKQGFTSTNYRNPKGPNGTYDSFNGEGINTNVPSTPEFKMRGLNKPASEINAAKLDEEIDKANSSVDAKNINPPEEEVKNNTYSNDGKNNTPASVEGKNNTTVSTDGKDNTSVSKDIKDNTSTFVPDYSDPNHIPTDEEMAWLYKQIMPKASERLDQSQYEKYDTPEAVLDLYRRGTSLLNTDSNLRRYGSTFVPDNYKDLMTVASDIRKTGSANIKQADDALMARAELQRKLAEAASNREVLQQQNLTQAHGQALTYGAMANQVAANAYLTADNLYAQGFKDQSLANIAAKERESNFNILRERIRGMGINNLPAVTEKNINEVYSSLSSDNRVKVEELMRKYYSAVAAEEGYKESATKAFTQAKMHNQRASEILNNWQHVARNYKIDIPEYPYADIKVNNPTGTGDQTKPVVNNANATADNTETRKIISNANAADAAAGASEEEKKPKENKININTSINESNINKLNDNYLVRIKNEAVEAHNNALIERDKREGVDKTLIATANKKINAFRNRLNEVIELMSKDPNSDSKAKAMLNMLKSNSGNLDAIISEDNNLLNKWKNILPYLKVSYNIPYDLINLNYV